VYRPLWSATVMAELERNLARRGLDDKRIRHRLDQLDLYPTEVLNALRAQASRYRREPRTVPALLGVLGGPASGCARFALACRQAF